MSEEKQLEKHIARAAADEAAAATTPEQRAANAVRAEINITLFKDGNLSVNGPWSDRVLFEGVMSVAMDAIRTGFAQMAAQERAQAEQIRRLVVNPALMKKGVR